MSEIVGKNEKFFYLPFLAGKLDILNRDFNSSHFCRIWLENLSFYDRRNANRGDDAAKSKFCCSTTFTEFETSPLWYELAT